MKNEKGFTLVEMMIVMLVISVLLIVTIPNVAKHNANINDKGCEAFVKMVEAQVQSYQMKHNKIPTLQQLIEGGYVKTTGCPDNKKEVIIGLDGAVTTVEKASVTP
ncbi:competence type IV pilus major pilin ComGC [Bacillus sp. MRMR6]|uniref:competence type IV pilus major pilin ComGC n=1 Tax=Bacillus sp. MRMR6 TaxID=1928617 RepID=UPI0009530008|nr:competence type IV pilus major pilin ComGC [Bacillus sp. MRMR6]OLS41707.1 competence protein ComG [Bacillus sp. MRMR6]